MTTEPAWVEHAIWWQVYPLGFLGADTTGADRTCRRPLDALVDWLDYAIELGCNGLALGPIFASETHGYDTVDYFRIDERLGDEAAFDRLVAGCRSRGIRIMLDGVFNHVGRSNAAAQGLLSGGDFEGHRSLAALDHRNPAVADLVTDVMTGWLERGADAWRLDAAYAVPPAFWAEVTGRVRGSRPEAYLMGEVLHGDYAAFVERSGLHSVTQYELWKAVWSSLHDRNLFELAHALRRHDELLASFVPFTFAGNHDVTRLATAIGDDRLIPHAIAVIATLPGTPAIYYGDERGATGVKEERFGGDDAIRPAWPASPQHLADDGEAVVAWTRELFGVRRRHPWLHRARVQLGQLSNEHLTYTLSDGEHRIAVALNLGHEPADLALDPDLSRALAGSAQITPTGVALPAAGWAVLAPGR